MPKASGILADHIICLSGFRGQEKSKLQDSLTRLGATITPTLTNGVNTVLICPLASWNNKREAAEEWNIPVVTHDWAIASGECGSCLPFDAFLVGEAEKMAVEGTPEDKKSKKSRKSSSSKRQRSPRTTEAPSKSEPRGDLTSQSAASSSQSVLRCITSQDLLCEVLGVSDLSRAAAESAAAATSAELQICRLDSVESTMKGEATFANGGLLTGEAPSSLKEISCSAKLPCGHKCGGVANESKKEHPPCFYGCSKTIGTDLCCVCVTEPLLAGPIIHLACDHYAHAACLQKRLQGKWGGPSLSWKFLTCTQCSKEIQITHSALIPYIKPLLSLKRVHEQQALKRLNDEYPGKSHPQLANGMTELQVAMKIYTFYPCFVCKRPYFGGLRECAQGLEGDDAAVEFKEDELVCPSCSLVGGDELSKKCHKHGMEYIVYKCHYCCNEATYFCWGKTHFCTPCHDNPTRMAKLENEHKLPKCPAGCKGVQLTGACKITIPHPQPGVEFCLGCGLCYRGK